MATIWALKTNRGRRVYDRKPHLWRASDLDRIAKAFAEDNSDEPLMMSEVADRVLFWLVERLGLDDVAGAAARVVVRLFELVRGNKMVPAPRTPRTTKEEEELLAWMSEMAAGAEGANPVTDKTAALLRLRDSCSSMIEWIDQELTP